MRALLLGSDGSQPGEPPGVVEGECRRLGEAREQLDVALGEVVRLGVLERHEADHRAPGEQHGVDAGVHAGRETGAAGDQQVGLGHRASLNGGQPGGSLVRGDPLTGRVPSRLATTQLRSVSS